MEKHMWHIGIAGSGLIADFHAKAIRDLPNAKIVGFSDNGSGKSTALAKKYDCEAFHDYRKLIHHPDVQVITIAAPSGAHLSRLWKLLKQASMCFAKNPWKLTPIAKIR